VKRDEKCEGIAKNGRVRAHPRAYAAGGDEELLLYGALTAIACALKAYGWKQEAPPEEGEWPGGLPH